MALLQIAFWVFDPLGRILMAIDDPPSKRYGPKVEGAGIHHNRTPGPADAKFLYGHFWGTLAWVVRHPLWHTIGLPLVGRLYVLQKDIGNQRLRLLRKARFQTKLVMAAELITEAAAPARVIVACRFQKDAALFDVPVPPKQRGRGRPRKYRKKSISLAKRAGQRRG
jgi:hypothetical protein